MSERNARVLSTIVLATLLGASVLMVTPAGGFPVSPGQNSLTQSTFGVGAPYMPWTPVITTNTFYLHSAVTGDGTVKYSTTDELDGLNPLLDVVAPTRATIPADTIASAAVDPTEDYGNQVAIGCTDACGVAPLPTSGKARFPVAMDLVALDTFRVYGFSTTVWAACTTGNLLALSDANLELIGIEARLIRQAFEGGAWVDKQTIRTLVLEAPGDAPTVAQRFSNSASFGNTVQGNGVVVNSGERLLVEYSLPDELFGDAMCMLYYDGTYPSSGNPRYSLVTLTSDAMRAATFSAGPAGGQALGFPSAGSTDSAGRRIVIEALQAHALGPGMALQLDQKHANVRLYDAVGAAYIYYCDSSNGNFPRAFATCDDVKLVSGRADQAGPEPDVETHLGNGVLRRSYTFAYPATLADLPQVRPEFYSFADNWVVNGPAFAIGGKGFVFERASFDVGTHDINPLEPTEFSFILRNTGTAADGISVAVGDPGDGWTARVQGGGLFFLAPGAVSLVTVELVPPANGVAGAQKSITVSASSSFSDVADPAPITATARIVNAVSRGVDISSANSLFQVRPGETKSFAVTVQNEGTRRDNFVIIPSFPSNLPGWTFQTTPSSVQVVAGGVQQVQVAITPPAEAATGMTFPLGLTAVQVGNSAISDRIDVTVDVFSTVGLILDVLDLGVERKIREDAPTACVNAPSPGCGTIPLGTPVPDTDFDRSALFRIPITNNGDRADQFRVEAVWDKTVPGTQDVNGCDGDPTGTSSPQPDGIPDGWRYRWQTDLGQPMPATRQWTNIDRTDRTAPGFAGRYQLQGIDNLITVPAGQTVYTYLEIGNVGGYSCGSLAEIVLGPMNDVNSANSPVAAMQVTVTSVRDPTLKATVPAVVRIDAAGTFQRANQFTGDTHAVGIEAPNGTTATVSEGQPGFFDLIVTNKANNKDGLKVQIAGATGWATHLVAKRTVPAGLPCDLPAADGSITCSGLGVYDDVYLQVVTTPGPNVQIGDVNPITVTVLSTDAPGITRTLSLVARAAGEFDFDLLPRGATTRPVVAGQTVSFPFVVNNAGTADDSYRFSLLTGSPVWQPVLSSSAPLFVPAGFQMPALLTVTAPTGSVQGFSDTFRIKVESVESGTIKTFEVTPIVQPASGLTVFGKDGQDVLIAKRNTDTNVTVRAVQVSGTPATQATFTVDAASLPPGWTVDRTTATVPLAPDGSGRPAGEAVFKVKAPANALGSGQGLLRVQAATVGTSPLLAATDLRLNLASTFGIGLNATNEGGDKLVIAPGGPALFNLTVQNLGLGPDVVRMSSTQAPAGWTVLFNPGTMSLGPLQKRTVEVKVTAPVSAQPADIASLVVFATSANSPTEIASIPLQAQVGFHALHLEVVNDGLRRAAPQETNVWVLNLTNNGTLPDEVRLDGIIDTKALASLTSGAAEPSGLIALEPNQTVQVRISQTFLADIPSNVTVQGRMVATSLLDARATPASASVTLTSQVLPYVASDVNRDRIVEYFVDRDLDASNGFEEFLPTKTPGGRPLTTANLERFLRDDARESFSLDVTLANGTVVRVVHYVIDGDNDGKIDHFLDADGDDLPEHYCDPDNGKCSAIDFRKDVNGDQVPEFFVDTGGDGAVDAVFDLTRGTFTRVLHIDVDGDGVLDYVVDKNGNGRVDQDETVLYTRTGHLLIVQKVDVDGDGRLDQVFDTNGDGAPDYFIPAASTASIAIVMQDMTGDGVQDWTYDGNNDGRRESYYDPVTGKAHVIDAAGHFLDALKQYWYIGALFALVLVLFAALVLVTRR